MDPNIRQQTHSWLPVLKVQNVTLLLLNFCAATCQGCTRFLLYLRLQSSQLGKRSIQNNNTIKIQQSELLCWASEEESDGQKVALAHCVCQYLHKRNLKSSQWQRKDWNVTQQRAARLQTAASYLTRVETTTWKSLKTNWNLLKFDSLKVLVHKDVWLFTKMQIKNCFTGYNDSLKSALAVVGFKSTPPQRL